MDRPFSLGAYIYIYVGIYSLKKVKLINVRRRRVPFSDFVLMVVLIKIVIAPLPLSGKTIADVNTSDTPHRLHMVNIITAPLFLPVSTKN